MSAQSVQLRRDPFARATLERRRVDPAPCAWCGSDRGRFVYAWVGDASNWERDSRSPFVPRLRTFCSVGCWEVFHA